jgi:hypothetical protein
MILTYNKIFKWTNYRVSSAETTTNSPKCVRTAQKYIAENA